MQSQLTKWLLSALAGVLAALGAPGFNLDWLVWISLIPLFLALDGKKLGRSFALAYCAGLVYFAVLLYWIFTLYEWAGLLIFPAYLLLIGYLSLYWGAFGALYSFLRSRLPKLTMLFLGPALWIVLEFIKAQGPLGFTWGDLAYALYSKPELIQIASVAGVWGVSAMVVLANSLLAFGLQAAFGARQLRPAIPWGIAGVATLAIFWGVNALLSPDSPSAAADMRVAVVQSETPQRSKGDPSAVEDVMSGYQRLLNSIDRQVDLVVLPETITLAGFPLRQPELLAPFTRFARERHTYLLLGLVDHRAGRYYNSAALIAPAGVVAGVYDKVHLVPFGEYIPLRRFWESIGLVRWVAEAVPGDYTRGRAFTPISSNLASIASPISFESILPQISRAFTRNGAQVLVAVTNEAWYKGSFALSQHFAMGVFRAVENRRFFIQSSNAGLSGVVSPRGQIVARSAWQKADVVYAVVSAENEMTLYARYGDWLVYLAVLYLAAAAFLWLQSYPRP